MIESKIDFAGKDTISVRIFSSRPRKMASFLLLFLACFSILIPFSVFLITDLNIGFGFIVTLIIFIGSGVYFFRLFLWNRYGSEVYQIIRDQFIFFYDYKLFKDRISKKSFKSIKLGYRIQNDAREIFDLEYLSHEDKKSYYLSLKVDEEIFNSRTEISASDLKKLNMVLDAFV